MAEPTPEGWVHDPAYFARRYAEDPHPWGFEDRWYERRKRMLVVALLPRRRYRRGLEPGCGTGALTANLAGRCDQLIAYDIVDAPLVQARQRLADVPNVWILRGQLPELWPGGSGDLVVLSEVAHYLSPAAAEVAADALRRWLDVGGTLIALHRTGETGFPRTGEEVGRWVDGLPFLERRCQVVEPELEAGVWIRRDSAS